VGRSKPSVLAAAEKPQAKKRASKAGSASGASSASRHPLARRRALAAAVLAVVAMLTLGGRAIWLRVGPLVASGDRYMLQADGITISELPEWIVGDVRGQVIESAGLAGRLSILDPNFLSTIENAFALHPWVASVDRIEKSYPPAVHVVLTYRQPIAVVEAPEGEATQLLPVDSQGIHLPAADVPLIRRSYLPRITGIVGQPPLGQQWDDPRVAGAIDLAVRLADEWEALDLANIVPSAWPEVQGDQKYFLYVLVNRGGTLIEWGASPRTEVPGEADFATKLQWLKQCTSQYAALEWPEWPERINIRRGIVVTPRTAKKPPKGEADPVVAEKPDEPAAEPVVK
jgi:hypothetical protein